MRIKEIIVVAVMMLSLLASTPVIAETIDSVDVRMANVTIVDDRRFPNYVRVEFELVNRATSDRWGEWWFGEESGSFQCQHDTAHINIYLWGDAIRREQVDTSIAILVRWRVMPDPSAPGKHGFETDAKTMELPLHLDLTGAEKRDKAFDGEWEVQQPYPNPFGGGYPQCHAFVPIPATVKIRLLDVEKHEKRTLYESKYVQGNVQALINAEGLPSGMYFLVLDVYGNATDTTKCMIIK